MATLRLPLHAPLRGVRLPGRATPGSPAAAKVQWLLQLGDAQRRAQEETKTMLATAQALQRTLQALPATVQARLDQVAALAVELGLSIAREIVGDALQRGTVDPTPTVVRCLQDCVHGASDADLQIHLHPDDLGPVLDALSQMPELRESLAAARLLPDPALPRGAVRAETAAGRLRYDPMQALERVAAAVRAAAAGNST